MSPRESSFGSKAQRTLSIRLIWPVLRVLEIDAEDVAPLAGIDLRALADPDTRLPHALVMELLERGVKRSGDALLGLRAGELLEPGDLGVLEYAARACGTLRSALECVRRYIGLVNDAVVASLEETGDRAIWKLCVIDGVAQPPCSNDFQLACSATISKRLTGNEPILLEAQFAHAKPAYAAEYDRIFRCELRFDAADNALVFPRAQLDTELKGRNPGLHAAYAMHAEEALRRLEHRKGISERVREMLFAQLRTGNTDMRSVARALSTTAATLRRHLEQEGTTLSDLLDEVRCDLATKYLGDPTLAITEVAFLLGFSHVPAFYKAFRRWHPGRTPADFRKRPDATD
jgi:AraC-like DNA-binding protein